MRAQTYHGPAKRHQALIRGVIFDYGETLVRSLRPWEEVKPKALHSAYSVLRTEVGIPTYDRFVDECDLVFDSYARRELIEKRDFPDSTKYLELVTKLFPHRSKVRLSRMSSHANLAFWRTVLRNYVLQKNSRRTLNILAKMNVRMAVISNHHNPEALMRHLEELGVRYFFSPIIASAQLEYRKPDPRIFLTCLSSMRLSRDEAVYVGDSPENDVVGSKRTGLLSVLLKSIDRDGPTTSMGIKPDFVIGDLAELPAIVSRVSNAT